ncbi:MULTISPECIES: hypothetical protein [unclassified Shimia]|uniref:hypothetical protein n=1 Tax=unclassified Shimia TaxID=2630038 RepID=UPI00310366E4
MQRIFCAIAMSATVLSGCGPTSYSGFAKPDASRETAARDDTACSVEANRLFPAANFTTTLYGGYHGGYGGYVGGTWGYPGYYGGSHVQMRDANASMRAEHRRDCMSLKGYSPATHPVCTEQQLGGRAFRPVAGAPQPAPNICAIRAQGGGVALVDLNNPT